MRRRIKVYAAGAGLLVGSLLSAGFFTGYFRQVLDARAEFVEVDNGGRSPPARHPGGSREQVGGIALLSLWLHRARVRAIRRRDGDSEGRVQSLNVNG